ncbi:MAG: hypothetical protein R2729_23340 [Bryobacteraceae bacterium]
MPRPTHAPDSRNPLPRTGRHRPPDVPDADSTDSELRALGSEIARKCGADAIFGPTKRKDRAEQKVNADFGGDWYALNDAVRMTLVAPDAVILEALQAEVRRRCVASNGLGLARDSENLPQNSPCSFSGLYFVVTLSNRRNAEIHPHPEPIYLRARRPASAL